MNEQQLSSDSLLSMRWWRENCEEKKVYLALKHEKSNGKVREDSYKLYTWLIFKIQAYMQC